MLKVGDINEYLFYLHREYMQESDGRSDSQFEGDRRRHGAFREGSVHSTECRFPRMQRHLSKKRTCHIRLLQTRSLREELEWADLNFDDDEVA